MGLGQNPKRIIIQQPEVVRGTSGGQNTVWTNWKKMWAKITPLSGTERRVTSHGGEMADARTEFKINYTSGVTEQMRISYAGKAYNIRHVKDPGEAHEWLILTCDTGVNDG